MQQLRAISSIGLAPLAVMLCCVGFGCRPSGGPSPSQSKPTPPAELQLTVVDDPPLAEAIGKLKAEWQARTGGSLAVRQVTLAEFAAQPAPGGDAIVYPAGLLGTLVERDELVRVPARLLAGGELAWSEVFPAVQAQASWGGVPYAVPFGSPVLVCLYRPDVLALLGRQPPTTWTEYQELAAARAERTNLGDLRACEKMGLATSEQEKSSSYTGGREVPVPIFSQAQRDPADAPWSGTLEPLAAGWAGRTLLARAAAYATHRDQYSTLFDIDSMAPLIAGPPFVRALTELVAARQAMAEPHRALDPREVQREFLAGHGALALTWLVGSGAAGAPGKGRSIGVALLPGSLEAYHVAAARWDRRWAEEGARVPLVSLAGRLGSVVQTSAHIDAAFDLLAWLAGPQWSARVCPASPAATLFRRSHLSTPAPWVAAGLDIETAHRYADVVERSLAGGPTLGLNLPGEADYWAALEAAVQSALSGRESPAAALAAAAAEWRTITERLGTDEQRRAYRRSLGLD